MSMNNDSLDSSGFHRQKGDGSNAERVSRTLDNLDREVYKYLTRSR